MFRIFPVKADKIPVFDGWQKAATTDQETIRLWGELYRERLAFWGVPTGTINDILVLDLDVKTVKGVHRNGFDSISKLNLHLPDTLVQRSLTGGAHFIFRYPKDGKHYGNRANLFGTKEAPTGIDVRGEGGYIVWYGGADMTKLIADAPAWLLADTAKPVYQHEGATVKVAPEIAQGIIQASLETIRQAPEGERNNTLNVEAFRVGQLVASQSITREFAEEALMKAAIACQLAPYEAKTTIRSGLDGGSKKPITSPFGSSEPVPSFPIPAPPGPQGRWTPEIFTRYDLTNTSKLRKPQLFKNWSTEDIAITTADGGTGKTTLKLNEAASLALGDRFLGFECNQSGKTLFITGEDSDKKLVAMLGAIVRQMGLFEEGVGHAEKIQCILDSVRIKKDPDLCLIVKDKQGFLHANPEAMRKVMEAVDDIKPKLIVFDPISSFWGSESMLNDMNKAVSKFMGELVDRSGACVEMINHMGKVSSNSKDMTQFAGRGGTGLPSHSRVSRALRPVDDDEFLEMTGETLSENQSAILCNVNKFTDGSPLYNKPFLIVRTGYLFSRKMLTAQKQREAEKSLSDVERVFAFVKEARSNDKYPTSRVIIGNFTTDKDRLSEERVKRAIDMLQFSGHMGEKLQQIENPDLMLKDNAYVITDLDGKEI